MFEDADRASGGASPHGAAPLAPARPAIPVASADSAITTLADAQAIIGLCDSLAGMTPAASMDALQASTTADADGADRDLTAARYAGGRFGPSEHELAVLRREAEAIHRIRALEDLKAACAAAQARETAALHQHRCLDEATRGIPASRQGLGLGSEIGLARRQTPHRGSTHLRQARHLTADLPHTLTALQTGQISEDHAATVERHTHWLPAPARRAVDTLLAGRLPGLSLRNLTHEVQAAAHGQDPEAAAAKYDEAVADRHVRVKATEHGMAYLTALLPALQAAACYQALTDHAATTLAHGEGGGRSPKQVLTDLFVQRLTGNSPEQASPVEIQLIMTDTALLAGDNEPAWIPGHGPLPATIARKLITPDPEPSPNSSSSSSSTGPIMPDPVQEAEARVFLRRLYTSPETGQLVAMDSQRREFTGNLRRMIMVRDDICRTPYCGAPIRHIDHATPHRDGGPTSYANGSGLCERCNYTKEYTGWKHQTTPHQLHVTTPTGHHYTSRPRPLTPPGTSGVTDLPMTPDGHVPGRQSPPGQRAVPCTTGTTTVTVRLSPGSTAVTACGQAARHHRVDLAWRPISRGSPGAPRTQVEYARAA